MPEPQVDATLRFGKEAPTGFSLAGIEEQTMPMSDELKQIFVDIQAAEEKGELTGVQAKFLFDKAETRAAELAVLPEEMVGEGLLDLGGGEVIGGAIGALGGFAVAGPPGAMIGATLFGMGGELFEQTMKELAGGKALTFEEAAEKAGVAGLRQGVFEIAGQQFIGPAIQKATGPFRKGVSEAAKKDIDLFESMGGGAFTVGQISDTRGLDIIEEVLGASLFGGTAVREATQLAQDKAAELMQRLGRELVQDRSPAEIGALIQDVIQAEVAIPAKTAQKVGLSGVESSVAKARRMAASNSSLRKQVERSLYKKLNDQIGKKAFIPTEKTAKTAKRVLQRSKQPFKVTGTKTQTRKLSSDVVSFLGDTEKKLAAKMDFEGFQAYSEEAIRLMSDPNVSPRGKAAINEVLTVLEREVDKATTSLGSSALQEFRAVKNLVGEMRGRFNNEIIQAVAEAKPSEVVKQIFFKGTPVLEEIQAVRAAVTAETWDLLQDHFLAQVIREGVDPTTGIPTASKMVKVLGERGEFIPTPGVKVSPIMDEIFNSRQAVQKLERFRDSLNILARAQQKIGEGTGRMLIQLTQGGALIDLAVGIPGGRFRKVSAVIILGPVVLAKLMTSKVGKKFLTEGLLTPNASRAAGPLGLRIAKFAFQAAFKKDIKAADRKRTKLGEPVVPLPGELVNLIEQAHDGKSINLP